MARKKNHEEHANHEAWAIPYADLMTLLLAFFVVMYAISSRNENKYKAVSDALNSAFGGSAKQLVPIQFDERPSIKTPAPIKSAIPRQQQQLHKIADDLEHALRDLIAAKLITVRRSELWLEVEINSDILFATGSAELNARARGILHRLACVLRNTGNPVQIEGYTDNRPIHNAQFASNWELSAARAASVVHLLAAHEVSQERLSMTGFGEYRPFADNDSDEGRNRNRRVMLVILAENNPHALPRHLQADSSPPPSPLEIKNTTGPAARQRANDTALPPHNPGQMQAGTP